MLLFISLVVLMPSCCMTGKVIMLPSTQPSHILVMAPIGCELVRRGHDVHCWLPDTVKTPPSSLTKCGIKIVWYASKRSEDPFNDEELRRDNAGSLDKKDLSYDIKILCKFGRYQCEDVLNNLELHQSLKSMKFDIALLDGFAPYACIYRILPMLDIPYVTITNTPVFGYLPAPFNLPTLTTNYGNPNIGSDDLISRARNLYSYVAFRLSFDPLWDKVGYELMSKSSLFLMEFSELTGLSEIGPANVKFIAGPTIRPAKPLPKVFQQFADSAKNGLIVGSFGSKILNELPARQYREIFSAMGKLKEFKFLFRYNSSNYGDVDVPDNVMISSWIPQNDLLAHRNTKLVITHFGNNALHEALYNGVPLLGFPVLGDQPGNAIRAVAKGYGLSNDLNTITSDEIVAAIKELVSNPRYKEKVKKASGILKSLPLPSKEGAFWVEHVMMHGSEHLKSPSGDLYLYQIIYLDLIVVVLITYFLINLSIGFYKRLTRQQHKKTE